MVFSKKQLERYADVMVWAMEESRRGGKFSKYDTVLLRYDGAAAPLARAVLIPDGRGFDGRTPGPVWTLEAASRGLTAQELEYQRLRVELRSRCQTPDGLTDEAALRAAIARRMGIRQDRLRPPRNECRPVQPERIEGTLEVRR